jgi:hypothetical protein
MTRTNLFRLGLVAILAAAFFVVLLVYGLQ